MGCNGSTQVQNSKKESSAEEVTVLKKYRMLMGKEDVMGEGTSSICRKGYEIKTNKKVAIKVYKEKNGSQKDFSKTKVVTLQKFKRQIKVLTELQEPFKKPSNMTYWCDELESLTPDRVFMCLLDHSKDAAGDPGPDKSDGTMYVVTELADYSLKDWLASCREKKKKLDKELVRNVAKAIVIAVAGLHAKGFVHIDMKPENLMMFGGRLKVIDVDGCVKRGSKISIQDPSISFSPCYCAPEWARFLISEKSDKIFADPALDAWSVGMTLAELVTFDAVLKPTYAQFLRNAQSHREASFLFMEWLGNSSRVSLPKAVKQNHEELYELIQEWLLVGYEKRKTLAQCLSHKYLQAGNFVLDDDKKNLQVPTRNAVERNVRHRPVDESTEQPLFTGILWKLNRNGDPMKADHWIKRDMWIAHNHSLCYYSHRDNTRLVLVDGSKLALSQVEPMAPGAAAREFAFTVASSEEREDITCSLAAESQEEMNAWLRKLQNTRRMDMIVTFRLGSDIAQELQAFRVMVHNRRKKVEEGAADHFQPSFRAKLWKLKGDGDRTKPEDWFERDMWIAKNGSLVYWSPKENSELIYYTAADVARSTIKELAEGQACRPWAFQVVMPPANGVEFAPGEFAAESEEERKQWIEEFHKCKAVA
mmetsp:Transcript_63454/g.147868  ORF Transcript_63454/g.147868 Transcript_63454/m.147868 type:complete len:647 (-) Transcript_63454:139-2079(-)|eukprot:CAMPEP_0171072792 /NCGR_PEP_ID=MMETSP0766_2-20121228/11084_1 /TAXON_ID=439317 /ORGANISM="Gambierdiscus australes, Strain CAWD 149" /LENGTH=646 /DNA_ID=CAMNT_0011529417 /DNA_START=42 /DNA_END=1982 /DNA_ORIENTATION=-